MADYCIQELQYKTKLFAKTGGAVVVYNGDVVKSDSAISSALRNELEAAVRPLEDVPEAQKDWHPGSDGQVLDLVHPSLFPVVYGVTRALHDNSMTLENCLSLCGTGTLLSATYTPPQQHPWRFLLPRYSPTFQWLPCDVKFEGEEGKVR